MIKSIIFHWLIAFLLTFCIFGTLANRTMAASILPPERVCFSPEGHCASIILEEILQAKHSIRVQAYSFTSIEISNALIDAAKRGLDVQVILDKSQMSERSSVLSKIRNSHIATYLDYCCAIAHNKIIIIDDTRIITGSYNFTKAAEQKNAENLLVLENRILANLYMKNWVQHQINAINITLK